MRIALLQLGSILANPEANGRAIEQAYREALARGAQLVITPEMAVPGYLAEDRMWEPQLRRRISEESDPAGHPRRIGPLGLRFLQPLPFRPPLERAALVSRTASFGP